MAYLQEMAIDTSVISTYNIILPVCSSSMKVHKYLANSTAVEES
jgi:hypothetical protein